MIHLRCYPVVSGCDDIIAADERFTGLSPKAIANLRALYDEYRAFDGKEDYLKQYEDKDIPLDTIHELANVLYTFRTELKNKKGSQILQSMNSSTTFANSFIAAAEGFSPIVLREYSEFVAALYIKTAKQVALAHNKKNPGKTITYTDVIQGIRSKNGKNLYGEAYIFDTIYGRVVEAFINNSSNLLSTIEDRDLWNVLLAWGPIGTMARTIIGEKERMNLGAYKSYAYEKSSDIIDLSEDIVVDFDVEESPKEGWYEDKNKLPLLSRVLDTVKREIANIVDENNTGKVTSLPYDKRLPLDTVHTFVAQILSIAPNSEEMYTILKEYEEQYREEKERLETAKFEGKEYLPTISMEAMVGHHLIHAIKDNVALRSALFVSYHVGITLFGRMRQIVTRGTGGIKEYYHEIINNEQTRVTDRIRAFLGSFNFPSDLFVRNNDGTLSFTEDAENYITTALEDLTAKVEETTTDTATGVWGSITGYKPSKLLINLQKKNVGERNIAISYLTQLLRNIGIDVNSDGINKAIIAGNITPKFIANLRSLYAQLLELVGEEINYNKIATSDIGYGRDLEELAKDLFNGISKVSYEPRALVLDKNGNKSSVSSLQAPCYFTDFIGAISFYYDHMKSASSKEEYEKYQERGLNFIKSKFAGSFILAPDDSTSNPILREIIESFKGTSQYLDNFKHERFAEMDIEGRESRAEALSDIDVVLTMFHQYYAHQRAGAKTAMFPLFILGDSNVQRYMTAPLYDNDTAINTLCSIIKSEEYFEKQLKAANEHLKSKSWGEITGTDKGITSSFLARIKERRREFEQTESDDEALKLAVIEVLNAEYNTFHSKWEEKGLNKVSKRGDLVYFGTTGNALKKKANVKSVQEANELLRNFVYNYAVNTISQLQMMTVSTMYYKSLEELQKRYKEIHASGSSLDITAVNSYAQPNEKGDYPPIFLDHNGYFYPYERVAYFDDILINIEKTDPDFAKVVADTIGKDSANYASYLTSTLTDGQSYRSIHSYRKIAIAQHQWSENHERWYQKLLEFKRTSKNGDLTAEQLKELDSYNISFQPQKPYLFTLERFSFTDKSNTSHTLLIPVQHKCAEVILIPELLVKGSNLRHIAEAMEEQHLDVVCSTEVVKVGGFGATSISYKTNAQNLFVDKEGNVIPSKDGKTEDITRKDQMKNEKFNDLAVALHGSDGINIKEALKKAYVHELDLSTYYRQQNLPSHTNDPRAHGTQMRKMVFTAINKQGDYSSYFPSIEKTEDGRCNIKLFSSKDDSKIVDVSSVSRNGGSNLCKFYNALIVQNIVEAFENLQKKMANVEQLAPILQQMSLNKTRNTIYDIINFAIAIEKGENVEEKMRDFLVPLCDPITSQETFATLISLFRKEVNNQVMHGGAAVQASAFGIDEVKHDDLKDVNYKDAFTPDDGNLKYVCEYKKDDEGNLVLDENEKPIPTNILYAECEIPFELSYIDEYGRKIDLEYDDWCNQDGTLKTKTLENGETISLLEEQFPGILDLVAYRIPTERLYSAINLRVKRFSRKTNGGTIKVPAAGAVIAGFDFDADKLYFLRKEFVYVKRQMTKPERDKVWQAVFEDYGNIAMDLAIAKLKHKTYTKNGKTYPVDVNTPLNQLRELISLEDYGFAEGTKLQDLFDKKAQELGFSRKLVEYQYDRFVNENTRVARNNEILRITQQRLMDKETLPARYTPGGFAPHKLSAKKIRILLQQKEPISLEELDKLASTDDEYRINYNVLNPWTYVEYNKQNQAAGDLIGIFANQNTNHIFSSIAHRIRLKNGISFAGKYLLSDLLSAETDTEVTTAGLLAASVDAVKDPVLNFFNLNALTADTGALLARLGFETDDIALLLNQPIIKEICDYYFNNHMSNFSNAVDKIKKKYTSLGTFEIPSDKNLGINLSKQELANSIVTYNNVSNKDTWIKNTNNIKFQLEVLDVFMRAHTAASELVSFVRATKFTASKSIDSTLGGIYRSMDVVNGYIYSENKELEVIPSEYLDKVLSDFSSDDILGTEKDNYLSTIIENPFAFEQAMYDMTRLFMVKTLAKYSPHETKTFSRPRNTLKDMTRNNILSKKSTEEIHKDLFLYLLTIAPGNVLANGASQITRLGKEARPVDYYQLGLPKVFEQIMQERKSKKANAFLESISIRENKNGQKYLVVDNSLNQNAAIREERMQAWSELVLSEDKADRELAFDLFMYCVCNTGFNSNSKSFIHYATPFIKTRLNIFSGGSYADFLRKVNKDTFSSINALDFAVLYIRNHTDDSQFVFSPYSGEERKAIEELAKTDEGYVETFEVIKYKPESREHTTYYSRVFLEDSSIPNSNMSSVKVIPAILVDNQLYMVKQLFEGDVEVADDKQKSVRGTRFLLEQDGAVEYVKVTTLGGNGLKNYVVSSTKAVGEQYQMDWEEEEQEIVQQPLDSEEDTVAKGTQEESNITKQETSDYPSTVVYVDPRTGKKFKYTSDEKGHRQMLFNILNLMDQNLKLVSNDVWGAGNKIDASSGISFDDISSLDIEAADVFDFTQSANKVFMYTDPRTGTQFMYQGLLSGHYLLKNRIKDFKEALTKGAPEELITKYSNFMDMILSLNNTSKIEIEGEQTEVEDKTQIIEKGLENLSEFEQEHVPTSDFKGNSTIGC